MFILIVVGKAASFPPGGGAGSVLLSFDG